MQAHCPYVANAFDLSRAPRRIGYWAVTVYVTISLPGHVLFLLTGDSRFFDGFPWWFSLAILPLYMLIVAYVITLRRNPDPVSPAGLVDGRHWSHSRSELGGSHDRMRRTHRVSQ